MSAKERMRVPGLMAVLFLIAGGLAASTGFAVTWALGAAGDSSGRLTQTEAQQVAEDWARGYVASTLGPQLGFAFEEMVLFDARHHEDVSAAVTSISSGISFGDEEKDFWSFVWMKAGVPNVTTGRDDGVAYVTVVVLEPDGRIAASGASVWQPEEFARAGEPLPAYEERFGVPTGDQANSRPDCGEWKLNGELQTCSR